MTNAAWETLSNQAIATAGLVYFLALLVHLAEWAAVRQPREGRELQVAAAAGGSRDGRSATSSTSEASSGRVAFLGRLGFLLTALAGAVHLVALVGRGMAADPNRVPWGNMYEFTISGTFVVTLLYVALYKRFGLGWMGPLVVGFVVTTLMVAVIWLHDEVAPLTEALNSPWLIIHVVSAIIATGTFTLGGIASVMYLVRARAERRATESGAELTGWLARVPNLPALDRLAYRVHAFAFPVWTFAVLITGPIWAHEAWSRYWNWDPKEVWAFITWVVYAGYLHARATAGWKGRNAAVLALIGLATLWFNFIGINYFSSTSQHSYAVERVVEVRSVES
ncbi:MULTISPECIES: c-type cytochrome biogenesis protein CcsB [Nocardioides]|uniref:C-type cytochrome biogenesis protein CcsB n=1 Tax=Nocardioides vastitatis TaxID=2568655 RepID=A0ABW0ZJZ5_9ACTN|nr:c-type cytochrome biogenesis protein CcsB [Nocardioides sp.]THJ10623.1 c-type cytochrome biogenesis protein CcsB [Nocardioides sp.]